MPTQTTLTDSDTDDTPTDDDAPTTDEGCTTPAESTDYTALAPSDQRGGKRCCPWCLSAAETFEQYDDGRVGCGNCDAVIPIGADWFERGEKIIV
jgi:hypothetical protein